MSEIDKWFERQDYNTGVEIYKRSPGAKSSVIRSLERGRSQRNMGLLILNLRLLKKGKSTAKKRKRKAYKPKKKVIPPEVSTSQQKAAEEVQHKKESSKRYFKKVKYGELPSILKLRFRHLKDLFYDRCDLKFKLNDLPDDAVAKALKIQKKIFEIDGQQQQIWKEIDHWQVHRTLLPTNTEDDFSKMDAKALFLKRASLVSSIRKMKKRLARWENEADDESDKLERRKILQQINRTTKRMHKNKINLQKVEDLLN